MGTVKGRHDMPVDDYILTDAVNPSDMDAINKAVFSRLAKVFKPYMVPGTVNVPNALEYVDVPAYVSTAELHLYVTGPRLCWLRFRSVRRTIFPLSRGTMTATRENTLNRTYDAARRVMPCSNAA